MKILIETKGGIIINIYSDTPNIQVEIRDWDAVDNIDQFTIPLTMPQLSLELDELEYEIY